MRTRKAARITATLAVAGAALAPASAEALTFSPSSLEDTAAGCSLRIAIQSANADTPIGTCPAGAYGDDVIVLNDGVYPLTIQGSNEEASATGDLDVIGMGTLTILHTGQGSAVIDAAPLTSSGFPDRVLDVKAGADLTISGVSVRAGNAPAADGGGIRNEGTLRFSNGAIHGNLAADDGAGISTDAPAGSLTVENATISQNIAGDDGGGVFKDDGPATLNNATVARNTVTSDGGGTYALSGAVAIRNTIVASNTDSGDGDAPDCAAGLDSLGTSLIGSTLGCSDATGPGDIIDVDALLGPLADNGGGSPTHALLAGSPAIDRGASCLAADQRGVPRPQFAACDIGAFELEPAPAPAPAAKAECAGRAATIVGTGEGERITGTTSADVIAGLGGNDVVVGLGGHDIICGGDGKDRLRGGAGKDRLLGQAGRDRLSGGSGKDRLIGGSAKDRLIGGGAKDRCSGGSGRDRGKSCERASSVP